MEETKTSHTKKIMLGILLVLSIAAINACMLFPYYKTLPYLPAVTGSVTDVDGNAITEVKVYWENEKPEELYTTYTDINGNYEFKVIYKYITWKFVAMDPGWGGTLVFEKAGYKTVKTHVGGFYDPAKILEATARMEKLE